LNRIPLSRYPGLSGHWRIVKRRARFLSTAKTGCKCLCSFDVVLRVNALAIDMTSSTLGHDEINSRTNRHFTRVNTMVQGGARNVPGLGGHNAKKPAGRLTSSSRRVPRSLRDRVISILCIVKSPIVSQSLYRIRRPNENIDKNQRDGTGPIDVSRSTGP